MLACNSSTQEAEAGGLPQVWNTGKFRPATARMKLFSKTTTNKKDKNVESNKQAYWSSSDFLPSSWTYKGSHQVSDPTGSRCSPKGPVPGRQHQPVPSPTKNHRQQRLPLTTFFTK